MCRSFVDLFHGQTSTYMGYPLLGNTDRALQVPEALKNHDKKLNASSSSEFTRFFLLKRIF
jgi:hypothetical protein